MAAQSSGRFVGAAVRLETLERDEQFRAAILEQCSYLTPELALKWAAIEPERGNLSLSMMDDLSAFARRNGMKVYGHTLLWHMSVPDWAKPLLLQEKDWSLIRKHFASIIPRFSDVIEYWDVINEPIDTGDREDGLRDSVFLQAFGPDYIARALHEARLFAPSAKLMINEFGLEYDIQVESDRRYHLLKLLENLKRNGVPLDGLGIQAHLDLRKGQISEAKLSRLLHEVTDLGLDIVVTELDVKETNYTANARQRDQEVADAAAGPWMLLCRFSRSKA